MICAFSSDEFTFSQIMREAISYPNNSHIPQACCVRATYKVETARKISDNIKITMHVWDRMRLKYRSWSIKNSALKGSIRGRDSFIGDIISRISGRNSHTLYPITATYCITEKFDNIFLLIYNKRSVMSTFRS